MADEKYLVAKNEVTLHRLASPVRVSAAGREVVSVNAFVLTPESDPVKLSELAPYQQEAAEAGELYGVDVVSESEAKKHVENREAVRAQMSGVEVIEVRPGESSLPVDNSFSDHRVTDTERAENHALRGAEEAGEAGSDDDEGPAVVGSDSEDSPANAGEETRDDVGEHSVDPADGKGGAKKASSAKSKK